jgi:hypothetical protein
VADVPYSIAEEGDMRVRGLGYDTGFRLDGARHPFNPQRVRRELEIIRDDLHCTAVRPFGNDLDAAAEYAAQLGLDVWYSPFTVDLDPDALVDVLVDAAGRAERLRQRYGVEVVFVAGAEVTIFNRGFLPGQGFQDRVTNLLTRSPEVRALIAGLPERVDEFFARVVPLVRQRFQGKVTYAAIPFEKVDWERFDIVALDAHRTKEVAAIYPESIRRIVAEGKPVAITEVGCAPYRGASDNAAQSGGIVEYEHGSAVRLDGFYQRDEGEQASYLVEMLGILDSAGVDLDMASLGIVKEYEDRAGADLPWEPKEAFHALADFYRYVTQPSPDSHHT